jgi:virginiamycin B lyase
MSNGVTEFTVPTASSGVQRITTGPDQKLWLTEFSAGKIAKVTTAGAFTEYSLGSTHAPFDIVSGPDGNLDRRGTAGPPGDRRGQPPGTVFSS